MGEESPHRQLLEEQLDLRQELAEEYKDLKQNPSFKKLFLDHYLGNRYNKLGQSILESLGRGEDCDDQIQTFREIHRFKEYLRYLEQGERSWLWKELYRKAEEGTLRDEDLVAALGGENG